MILQILRILMQDTRNTGGSDTGYRRYCIGDQIQDSVILVGETKDIAETDAPNTGFRRYQGDQIQDTRDSGSEGYS